MNTRLLTHRCLSLTFLAVLVCSAVTASAQDKMKLPARTKHTGEIERSYDKFTGQTSYTLNLMKVAGERLNGLFFSAFTRLDAAEKEPPLFVFTLNSITPKEVRASDAALYVILDGERKNFGEMDFAGSQRVETVYFTTYTLRMSPEVFSKLATAKKVEMRFDGIEFELTEDHRNALLDFLSYARSD